MSVPTSTPDQSTSVETFFQVVAALVLIQVARAAVGNTLWLAAHPGATPLLLQVVNSLAFILVGAGLLVWRRPSPRVLGLTFGDASRTEQVVYLGGAMVVLALLLSSILLDPVSNIVNLHFAVVVPLFEELLFRGWAWSRLEGESRDRNKGLVTWLTITGLFALWHLGYADTFLRHQSIMPPGTLQFVLVSKVIVGLAVGLIVGLVRWRTGKVFGGLLIHALWNIFA